ncbi:MAG: hypothetical protein HOY78_32390 [Saccharothrix sp.]|nr:hypothetical protein [Saccharothrix sp.]
MAYPTAEDLRRWLRHTEPFTPDETEAAELFLEGAVGAVEEEAGQALLQSTDTVTLDGTGTAKLILPRWPVTAVAEVIEDGELLAYGKDADYTWSASGLLTRRCACWPHADQIVDVTYTAGFTVIPPSLKRIVLRLAAEVWSNPTGLASETIGDWARSWKLAGGTVGELTDADRRAINAYRART